MLGRNSLGFSNLPFIDKLVSSPSLSPTWESVISSLRWISVGVCDQQPALDLCLQPWAAPDLVDVVPINCYMWG